MNSGFYSTSQLKQRYDISSTNTIKAWQLNKGFPAPVFSGNGTQNRYSVEQVHAWEQSQSAAA